MKYSNIKITVLLVFFVFCAGIFLVFLKKNNAQEIPVSPSPTPQTDYLQSYFTIKDEYLDSFAKSSNITKERVLAAITSHHFLAKDSIAETFAGIDPTGIQTVIIVSPDHFHQITDSHYMAQTSDAPWRTPFGDMHPNLQVIHILSQNKEVYSDSNLFRSEHGIYTLVPFAKYVFPDATLVPLVLRQKNDYSYYYNLGEHLSKMVDVNHTLVVISSDFTHYTSIEEAKENDQKSIQLLPNKNIEDVVAITNDCTQCTAFLFGYLKNTDTTFKRIFNINSYDISGKDPENVTSYIGAYFTR